MAFSDLPRQIRSDVDEIFHVNGKLPGGWVSKVLDFSQPIMLLKTEY